MAQNLNPGRGCLMPADFGPAWYKPVSHYGSITQLIVLYVTDRDAMAALLPPPYEPADEPSVQVYFQLSDDVDFMAGRGYNIVGVNLSVVFNGKKDRLVGNYAVLLWENDTQPILQGRELLGTPKIFADIPAPRQEGNDWTFDCSLYGTKLCEGAIKNATRLDKESMQLIEDMSQQSYWLAWKFIPRPDWSGPDLSYPTLIPYRLGIEEAWLGEGSHKFFDVTWEQAPTSAHIIKGLQTLVVKEYRPSIIIKGTLDLLISETRMLE